MPKSRVLAIFLDGYEQTLGAELMDAGEMPALANLRDKSACFLLDHGPAQRTGLAGEHVSTGLSPQAAERWAAVSFDPSSYTAWQEGTRLVPFPTRLDAQTVVFDVTYFDLTRAPGVQGLVGWGAHDPGVDRAARPAGLEEEFSARFGCYPASAWIYGFTWPSVERSRQMGQDLVAAVDLRATAAQWLLQERLPDWDLALIGVSETHSAIEALWHGIDPTHALHDLPSAEPAGDGVRAVYVALDRLVAKLTGAFEDASVVVFAMGGMGPNRSDVASMALLPELLYRNAFGSELLAQSPARSWNSGEDEPWRVDVPRAPSWLTSYFGAQSMLGRIASLPARYRRWSFLRSHPDRHFVDWIPAAQYQSYWHRMPAFALPSYYDGRIRINLVGRERRGIVPLERYRSVCDEIEALLRACSNPDTGEGVVDFIERFEGPDPLALNQTESDMVVVWRDQAVSLEHPSLGRVGPVPFRRTGGHTGRYGMAFISDEAVEPGYHGVRSSFDVVPTIVDLLGLPLPSGLSGTSMLPACSPT